MSNTSWQKVGDWYDSIVGDTGSYYHQKIILPGVLRLLDLKPGDSLIDLACGQGVLASHLPKEVEYLGLDAAKSLLQKARSRHPEKRFVFADLTKPLPIEPKKSYTHACCILALQNISEPALVLKGVAKHMQEGSKLVLVINHPCFRIPRQSHWGQDEQSKLQYRRVNLYMTPQKIPIATHPGKSAHEQKETISFHFPLSSYFQFLHESGFVVESLQEWCSDKVSTGKMASMENRARREFPLFLALKGRLLS
jgi:ubiquinone/menaquinone biosynthesis C-methylase UbiE